MSRAASIFSVQFVSQATAEPAYESFDFSPADEDEKDDDSGIDWLDLDAALADDPGSSDEADGAAAGGAGLDDVTGSQEPAGGGEGPVDQGDLIFIADQLGATVVGTTGDDTLMATEDHDVILGGAGNDTIYLWKGQDVVMSGDGDDVIVADNVDATAQHMVYGGDGDDALILSDFAGTFAFLDGSNGHDTVVLAGTADDYAITLSNGGMSQALVFSHKASDQVIQIADVEDVSFFEDGFVWTIPPTPSLELFVPYAVAPDGSGGVRFLADGEEATAQEEIVQISESDGTTRITGTSGADEMVSDTGYAIASGGAGDDTFSSAGWGIFDGGEGYDTLDLSQALNADFWRESLDLYHVSAGSSFFTVSGVEAVRLADGTVLELSQDAVVDGTDGNDELFASANLTTLDGGAGDDILNDYNGADTLIGGDGNDLLNGRWGQNTLIGGDGDDRLYSSDFGGVLDGGAGDDELMTLGGEMTGGDGADVFHLMLAHEGTTVIHDFNAGEDRLADGLGADFSVTQKGTSAVIASELQTIIIEHASAASVLELLAG